jgi:AcrR family transcriptional regulator
MPRATAKRPRGRPPLPREAQRQRLIDGAWRAFERNRYERTTVADIVGEAGMSSRTFYEHFASKEDLVAGIVEELGARLLAEVRAILAEPEEDAQAQADRGLRAFLELLPSATVDVEQIGGKAGRRMGEVRRRLVQAITDLVHAHLGRLHARGAIARTPARVEVELILTGIEGMGLRYYSEGRRDELLALRPKLLSVMLHLFA